MEVQKLENKKFMSLFLGFIVGAVILLFALTTLDEPWRQWIAGGGILIFILGAGKFAYFQYLIRRMYRNQTK